MSEERHEFIEIKISMHFFRFVDLWFQIDDFMRFSLINFSHCLEKKVLICLLYVIHLVLGVG